MRPIDQEICSLLKVRKIGGMELLFREYYKPLVVWATTFLHDTQRAEDIVQDFFVKLWEKPYSALLPETLKSYLFTSIRNLALNQLDKIDPLRSKFGKIEKEEVSLEDKMEDLKKYAAGHRHFSFRGLLTAQSSKVEVIVTFLAILELMKMGTIRISQEHIFDDIQIDSKVAA